MVKRHLEAFLYGWLWLNASALAWIAGRPWLAAVGLVTVLPFLVAYARRASTDAQSRRRTPS